MVLLRLLKRLLSKEKGREAPAPSLGEAALEAAPEEALPPRPVGPAPWPLVWPKEGTPLVQAVASAYERLEGAPLSVRDLTLWKDLEGRLHHLKAPLRRWLRRVWAGEELTARELLARWEGAELAPQSREEAALAALHPGLEAARRLAREHRGRERFARWFLERVPKHDEPLSYLYGQEHLGEGSMPVDILANLLLPPPQGPWNLPEEEEGHRLGLWVPGRVASPLRPAHLKLAQALKGVPVLFLLPAARRRLERWLRAGKRPEAERLWPFPVIWGWRRREAEVWEDLVLLEALGLEVRVAGEAWADKVERAGEEDLWARTVSLEEALRSGRPRT